MRRFNVLRLASWTLSGVGGCVFAVLLFAAGGADAAVDSCREWRQEHLDWKTETLRRYLRGAPQRELDGALFELLQREAYLTSCDVSVRSGRDELVGWRLLGRAPEEYGSAVVESVLERAGFDVGLASLLGLPDPAGDATLGDRLARRRADAL